MSVLQFTIAAGTMTIMNGHLILTTSVSDNNDVVLYKNGNIGSNIGDKEDIIGKVLAVSDEVNIYFSDNVPVPKIKRSDLGAEQEIGKLSHIILESISDGNGDYIVKNVNGYAIVTYKDWGGVYMGDKPVNMFTREQLIALCELAFVKQEDWKDRDSAKAQTGVAMSYMLLKAGCKYEISEDGPFKGHTMDIVFWVKDFMWFDILDADEQEYPDGLNNGTYSYYLPTPYRLDQVAGKDWY